MWIVRSVLYNRKNVFNRHYSEVYKKPDNRIYQFGEFMGNLDSSRTKVYFSPNLVDFDGYHITSISSCWLSTYFCTRPEGMVFAWGVNEIPYLGLPHIKEEIVKLPSWIHQLDTVNVVQVSTGRAHTLYRTAEDKVLAIGNQEFGQLGDGVMEIKVATIPQKVEDLESYKIVDVATGLDHSLALTADGHVYSWGYNREGQLGLGQDTDDVAKPTRVQGIEKKIIRVYCGLDYSIALTDTGEFYGWGNGEMYQLGNMEQDIKLVPVLVSIEGEKVIDIAPAGISVLALTESGDVFSWGKGNSGRLGHGDDKDQCSPKKIAKFSEAGKRIVQVAGRGGHHLALSEDGILYSWGLGNSGRLGQGDETDRYEPTRISFFDDKKISLITCGLDHSLVLTEK